MAHYTSDHLHHMARRHHQTMKKLDGFRDQFNGIAHRALGTIETGLGAWAGGVIEGFTSGGTFLNVPINLGASLVLIGLGHWPKIDDHLRSHLNNLGNGLLGSYVAATGYSFGKRWRAGGFSSAFGGFTHPYADGGLPPAVHGDLTQAQMAAIVQRMQATAAHP